MFDTRERKERALGTKLGLKPFRSLSPKAAIVRKPQRPGQHGGARRRAPSEFGEQLSEKQKFKYTYGLREAQMRRIFKLAAKSPSNTGPLFMGLLERRLDNVVYRLGIAPSRSVARQLVGHGHIQVSSKGGSSSGGNFRRVKSPSFQVKAGDVIRIRPESKNHPLFKDLAETLKKYEVPAWLSTNPETFEGKVLSLPRDLEIPFDISKVVDYYSKIVK